MRAYAELKRQAIAALSVDGCPFTVVKRGKTVDAREKRLNEMDRLGDMGHFPAVVNAGATVNVLVDDPGDVVG